MLLVSSKMNASADLPSAAESSISEWKEKSFFLAWNILSLHPIRTYEVN